MVDARPDVDEADRAAAGGAGPARQQAGARSGGDRQGAQGAPAIGALPGREGISWSWWTPLSCGLGCLFHEATAWPSLRGSDAAQ